METNTTNNWSWDNFVKNVLCLTHPEKSWIHDESMTWTHRFCAQVLSYGEIPKHIAFILDGNRRYSKKNCISMQQSYAKGFDKIFETIQWCLHLGIKEVTVNMSSLNNFKRTQEEIDALFDEIKTFLIRDMLNELGVCITFFGNIKTLPDDMVKVLEKSMLITKQNNKISLNIAFSYTGHDELTNAFNQISNGIKNNDLEESDLSVEILNKCMYTYPSPPPDLLVCTSGETKLSDFMLWQCAYSYIYFTSVLWPEFTAWDFMIAIFMYQRNFRAFIRYKIPTKKLSPRGEKFVENVHQNRLNSLFTIA
ncbi:dehydrodolichyl diphosphate synthase complex subunit DHDDS-like [Rhopalosiphum maidis]|uniref:dehydrodolichyl diphosphate synthase complex subunit DHDDS-like n=1 Tax=Rhopalosiphum maidis TaxID=43146 RepID=UPI000F006832|nr:dehydrodolichyl diphosphate synthase complex subunit DHDDS-like [Rhopalosiphum maidis]XP_026805140.1 dehydrodolichyl diphosphate synthase complex subunit DHDDS-like [Rhopalosiphum maidis]